MADHHRRPKKLPGTLSYSELHCGALREEPGLLVEQQRDGDSAGEAVIEVLLIDAVGQDRHYCSLLAAAAASCASCRRGRQR